MSPCVMEHVKFVEISRLLFAASATYARARFICSSALEGEEDSGGGEGGALPEDKREWRCPTSFQSFSPSISTFTMIRGEFAAATEAAALLLALAFLAAATSVDGVTRQNTKSLQRRVCGRNEKTKKQRHTPPR